MNKKILHTVIDNTVSRFPDNTAVIQGSRMINYRDLGRAVNNLSALLMNMGVKRGALVGICLQSSIEYIITITAVMKAGGIFVPFDLTLPKQRLDYMFSKTKPTILICFEGQHESVNTALNVSNINECETTFILFREDMHISCIPKDSMPYEPNLLSQEDTLPPNNADVQPDDGCYVMYTSGSTGLPKAILGCHKGLSHFIHWEAGEFELSEDTRATQFAPLTFDASLRDIFVPLITGGTVCLVNPDIRANVNRLIRWIDESSITLMHCVPSLFRLMIREIEGSKQYEGIFSSLRYILMAGEPLYGRDVLRWREAMGDRIELVNLYGPSETTLIKTFHRISGQSITPNMMIPAGIPISNTAVIIAKGSRLCGIGEIGDIYIKTPFMTKGYYGDPEETGKVFIANPISNDPSDIVYKTGDIGRYMPDRAIEFIGRLDSQVKVNGIRIELAEIERALLSIDRIDQSVVLAHKNLEHENVLVCYYTQKQDISPAEIRDVLNNVLPPYMLPSFYLRLDRFPLNINGKIDRKALPKPEEILYERTAYEPPRDREETILAKIWGDALRLNKVGVTSPYFEIGGHSLAATLIVSRIYRETGIEVSLRDFFEKDTIRNLAAHLRTLKPSFVEDITPIPVSEDYTPSHGQKRLWILDRLEEGSKAYNLASAYSVEGDLDTSCFKAAVEAMIRRHESLRTVFALIDGEPRQKVIDADSFLRDFKINIVDEPSETLKVDLLSRLAVHMASKPFDLSAGPLLRLSIVCFNPSSHGIVIAMHHIISDAWSFDVMAEDIWQIYGALRHGNGLSLPILQIQYKDYAAWQQERVASGALSDALNYWKERLAPPLPVLEMMTDLPRPILQQYKGEILRSHINIETLSGFKRFLEQHRASMFMGMLTLIYALLHRYTQQGDIIIGSPAACRDNPMLGRQIGFYANTIALRTNIDKEDSLTSLLSKVREVVVSAFDHQAYPFDLLIDELNIPRNTSRSPLFDVMLVYEDNPRNQYTAHGLRLSEIPIDTAISRVDLVFECLPDYKGMRVDITYNTGIFKRRTIERLSDHLNNLLANMLIQPLQSINEIGLISKKEQDLLIRGFNNTRRPYPLDKSIIHMFHEQVMDRGDAEAVIFRNNSITYAELYDLSMRVARYLMDECHVKSEEFVAVMTGRNHLAIISMIAVMSAGCAYLPIDPSYPVERIKYMLSDSSCKIVITTNSHEDIFSVLEVEHVLDIDKIIDSLRGKKLPSMSASSMPSPDSLAYAIYTSGSTGKPKGTLIEHRGFVNMILDQIQTFGVLKEDRVLQFASLSFDASLSEMFMALLSGATLVMVEQTTIGNPLEFISFLKQQGITNITLSPSYLRMLDHDPLETVRTIITAGGPAIAEDTCYYAGFKDCFNGYGPTEASVCATMHRIKPEDINYGSIPIGKPVANTSIYILDSYLQPAPIGVAGEIYVSGPGVARGYIGIPEMASERFIADPFCNGLRMYRTGDVGRWLDTGEIQFIGRIDEQVKISGYRIELEEIRRTILRQPAVKDAAVVALPDREGIAAYIVCSAGTSQEDIKGHISRFLPQYMHPSFIVFVDAIPLTLNGKIDKRALLFPSNTQSHKTIERPRNPLERAIASIWESALNIKGIGIYDNFFELGGNSLKSVQITGRISGELKIPLSGNAIFLHPTIAELAQAADEIDRGAQGNKTEIGSDQQDMLRVSSSSSMLTFTSRFIEELISLSEIKPVHASALVCLPDPLNSCSPGLKALVMDNFPEGRPIISGIIETFLGRIAIIMLPLCADELFSSKDRVTELVVEAMRVSSDAGGRFMSLTGLIPAAIDYDVPSPEKITTGLGTIASAAVLSVQEALSLAGRAMDTDILGIVGLGKVSSITIPLLMRHCPQPKGVILYDPFLNKEQVSKISDNLLRQGIFTGDMEIAEDIDSLYEASLHIVMTQAKGIIDINKVKKGTVLIAQSGEEPFLASHAFKRLAEDGDILFTESDVLSLPKPAPCLMFMPHMTENALRSAGFSNLFEYDPNAITGCVLSGLLSFRSNKLFPSSDEVDDDTTELYYNFLVGQGFKAASPRYRGQLLR